MVAGWSYLVTGWSLLVTGGIDDLPDTMPRDGVETSVDVVVVGILGIVADRSLRSVRLTVAGLSAIELGSCTPVCAVDVGGVTF